MNIKKIHIFSLLSFLLFSSCGYKTVVQLEDTDYQVGLIKLSGEKRIGYAIKNDILLNSSKNSNRVIDINLKFKKNKSIKEKNISNKITKYSLNIIAEVEIIDSQNNTSYKKTFNDVKDYSVANNHSGTLANEKKALENSLSSISNNIIQYKIRS